MLAIALNLSDSTKPGTFIFRLERLGGHCFVDALIFRNQGSDEASSLQILRPEICVFGELKYVATLWNRLLLKKDRLFYRSNRARIGGAHAENQKASRFVTARTKAQASRRRKSKSRKSGPSLGAVASIQERRLLRRHSRGTGLSEVNGAFSHPSLFCGSILCVGNVERREVDAFAGRVFSGDFELMRDEFNRIGSMVFHHTQSRRGFENHDEHAMFVHIGDEEAEIFALLIGAAEVLFVDEAGDGLIGHESAGCQRADAGQVKSTDITLLRDQESALVNDQRRRGVRAGNELAQRCIQFLDVVLGQLWQDGHIMCVAERFG